MGHKLLLYFRRPVNRSLSIQEVLSKTNLLRAQESIGGDDAVQAIKEIGFSSSYRIDPVLLDDEVWLLWNKEDVTIEVFIDTPQTIFMQ
ncbi:hypothetical protein CFP56_022485 [Quercus suber]|uniref:Uncharacterized protein n=1 Tax=Quercus suber TaxID=58331 RepID=A0AAW0KD23_QUESU